MAIALKNTSLNLTKKGKAFAPSYRKKESFLYAPLVQSSQKKGAFLKYPLHATKKGSFNAPLFLAIDYTFTLNAAMDVAVATASRLGKVTASTIIASPSEGTEVATVMTINK